MPCHPFIHSCCFQDCESWREGTRGQSATPGELGLRAPRWAGPSLVQPPWAEVQGDPGWVAVAEELSWELGTHGFPGRRGSDTLRPRKGCRVCLHCLPLEDVSPPRENLCPKPPVLRGTGHRPQCPGPGRCGFEHHCFSSPLSSPEKPCPMAGCSLISLSGNHQI